MEIHNNERKNIVTVKFENMLLKTIRKSQESSLDGENIKIKVLESVTRRVGGKYKWNEEESDW